MILEYTKKTKNKIREFNLLDLLVNKRISS